MMGRTDRRTDGRTDGRSTVSQTLLCTQDCASSVNKLAFFMAAHRGVENGVLSRPQMLNKKINAEMK